MEQSHSLEAVKRFRCFSVVGSVEVSFWTKGQKRRSLFVNKFPSISRQWKKELDCPLTVNSSTSSTLPQKVYANERVNGRQKNDDSVVVMLLQENVRSQACSSSSRAESQLKEDERDKHAFQSANAVKAVK